MASQVLKAGKLKIRSPVRHVGWVMGMLGVVFGSVNFEVEEDEVDMVRRHRAGRWDIDLGGVRHCVRRRSLESIRLQV